jgi:hypothetical protein
VATINGWRGQPIVGVRSRGPSQTFWARDWRDLVLDTTGDIAKKSGGAPGASGWFTDEDHTYVTEVDDKCSYLQSLQSEDTVTWTAFGRNVSDAAVTSMLDVAFGSAAERPRAWSRLFWQRFVHPDTGRLAGGPEPDVVFDAPGRRYVVEAKRLADLDDGQGVAGKTNQLAMRHGIACSGVPDSSRRGVLVIVPGPERYGRHTTFSHYFATEGDGYRPLEPAIAIEARAITWEQVTDAIERDVGPTAEVVQYLRWRLGNIRR